MGRTWSGNGQLVGFVRLGVGSRHRQSTSSTKKIKIIFVCIHSANLCYNSHWSLGTDPSKDVIIVLIGIPGVTIENYKHRGQTPSNEAVIVLIGTSGVIIEN